MSLGLRRCNLSRWSGAFEFGLAVPIVGSTVLFAAAEANQFPFSREIRLVIADIDGLLTSRTRYLQHGPIPFSGDSYLGAPSFVVDEDIDKRAKDLSAASCWLLVASQRCIVQGAMILDWPDCASQDTSPKFQPIYPAHNGKAVPHLRRLAILTYHFPALAGWANFVTRLRR